MGRDQQGFRHSADKSWDGRRGRARVALSRAPGLAGKLLGNPGRHLREHGSLEELPAETFGVGFSVYTFTEVEISLARRMRNRLGAGGVDR